MEKLPEYLAVFDEEFEGVFAISLVDLPANEFMFVRLSKIPESHTVLSVVDEEKRLVTGVVLVPEQKILRYDEQTKEYYYLVFTEEDIAKFSRQFIKSGYQQNSTENHDYGKQIENLTFVETWIVGDPSNDKANALGFDVPKGTWMVSGYVEDDEVLQKIKNKELNGFSIDGILKKVKKDELAYIPKRRARNEPPWHDNCQCEYNRKTGKFTTGEDTCDYCKEQAKKYGFSNIKDNNMNLLKKLVRLMSEETQLILEIPTEDYGTITVEELKIGNIVYDADMKPLPNIEFEFEGFIFKTDDTGAIESSEAIPAEEIVVEEQEVVIDPPPTDENLEGQLVEVVMENGDVFTCESFSVGDELFLNGELYTSQTTDIEGHRITTDENGVITSNEEIIQEVENLRAEVETLKAQNLSSLQEIETLKTQIDTLSAAPAVDKLKSNENKNYKETAMDKFYRIAANHKK